MEEYLAYMKNIDTMADNIYRYLNFDQIAAYMEAAEKARKIPLTSVQEVA
jgi:aconitate hydratase 2/2-methylisocitrate dehydratase